MKQKNQQERDLITRPHENSFMDEFDIAHCGQALIIQFKNQTEEHPFFFCLRPKVSAYTLA